MYTFSVRIKKLLLVMLFQAPYCPPKKELSTIEVFPGTYWADMRSMLAAQCFPDLVFVTGNSSIAWCILFQWLPVKYISRKVVTHSRYSNKCWKFWLAGEFEINAHRFLVSAGAPEFLWFLEAETYTSLRRNSEASETVRFLINLNYSTLAWISEKKFIFLCDCTDKWEHSGRDGMVAEDTNASRRSRLCEWVVLL